ncbi:hypothetical protein K0M31_004301 [Melipona bicolor]|uniref:Uncharacterized protein n=1 Tax=Melipona bicolor TaxID=60889 RepID=A0AA40FX72_9HYME|nr:hypothetical protein K0M31_004301 [Melipona bicolor]
MEEMSPRRSLGNGLSPSFASQRTDPWLPAASAGKNASWDVGQLKVENEPNLTLIGNFCKSRANENNKIFLCLEEKSVGKRWEGDGGKNVSSKNYRAKFKRAAM